MIKETIKTKSELVITKQNSHNKQLNSFHNTYDYIFRQPENQTTPKRGCFFRVYRYEFNIIDFAERFISPRRKIRTRLNTLCRFPTQKPQFCKGKARFKVYEKCIDYSHSIVAGGLPLTSYTTRLMPRTSLMMRLDTRPSSAYGSSAQCAVIKSLVTTARSATT